MPVFHRVSGAWRQAGGGGGSPFILGETLPDATNAGADLTLINGTLTGTMQIFSTPGQVVSNKRIEGFVRIAAAGITFDNVEVVGPATYAGYPGQGGVVSVQGANFLMNRSTVKPRDPAYYQVGVDITASGTGSIIRRCDVSQCTDLFGVKTQCTIEGCWGHNQVFFDGQGGMANNQNGSDHASDDRWPGWEHNDVVQLYSGNNVTIEGNRFEAFFVTTLGTPNTAINGIAATGLNPDGSTFSNGGRKFPQRNYLHNIFSNPSAATQNLRIRKNWLGGGENLIQLAAGAVSGNSALIDGNRFRLDGKGGTYRVEAANPHLVADMVTSWGTVSIQGQGNVWDIHTSVPSGMQGTPIDGYRTGTTQVQYLATI